MHDIPLTETDFRVTVTVLNSNRLPMVQGWGPLTSWYRVEDGTEPWYRVEDGTEQNAQ